MKETFQSTRSRQHRSKIVDKQIDIFLLIVSMEHSLGSQIEPAGLPRSAQSIPRALKSSPRAARATPKHPKSAPRASKSVPRAPQERPRVPQERPRAPQERPRCLQDATGETCLSKEREERKGLRVVAACNKHKKLYALSVSSPDQV